jgi:hypothetical protein
MTQDRQSTKRAWCAFSWCALCSTIPRVQRATRGDEPLRNRKRAGHRIVLTLALAVLGAGFSFVPASAAQVTPSRGPGSPALAAVLARYPSIAFRRICQWPPPRGHISCMALVPVVAGKSASAENRSRFRDDAPDSTGTGGCAQVPIAVYTLACYGPADLQSAYGLTAASSADGSNETVAVTEGADDPNIASDLAAYRSYYGLPPCTTANGCFKKVNDLGQQSNYPAPDVDWAVEESLDVDMVSAICPHCHILVVEAANGDVIDQPDDTAVSLGAKFVSNSWGTPDLSEGTADYPGFNHPGVAITASAGDNGYGVLTSFPAADSYVTAVGGTSLLPASNARGWDEVAWSGTGSGCSFEPKPSWQHDSGCKMKTNNDVAAVADPDTGVAIYDTYDAYDGTGGSCNNGWCEAGGTSASSPIVASVYALAGTPKAGTYPASYPYADPSALNDVVGGTNSFSGCTPTYLCTAGPGYDGPTGLGTPHGTSGF